MKMKKKKKGISLIVLIITIIIMIIIAGAIILSLNVSNVIGRANNAKQTTNYQSAKEIVLVAKTNWELMKSQEKEANGGTFPEYAKNKLVSAGYPENGEGSYRVSEEGDLAVIPKGFMASSIEGETIVDDGLVIYEGMGAVTDTDADNNGIIDAQENRNQYVWVPVQSISEFRRKEEYITPYLKSNTTISSLKEPSTYGNLSKTNDYTGEWAEYEKMYNSVKKYGGFYIARYEAGSETERINGENGTTTLIPSKKDKYVYSYVGWGPHVSSRTMTSGDVIYDNKNWGKGAVELARSAYPESSAYGVVSTLCYGVQWDAIMDFMKDVQNTTITPNKLYIFDSTNMGRTSTKKTGTDLNSGTKLSLNKVKNIYDIAGNLGEWTMEAITAATKMYRGVIGSGPYLQCVKAAAAARLDNAAYKVGPYDNRSFRIALYLK